MEFRVLDLVLDPDLRMLPRASCPEVRLGLCYRHDSLDYGHELRRAEGSPVMLAMVSDVVNPKRARFSSRACANASMSSAGGCCSLYSQIHIISETKPDLALSRLDIWSCISGRSANAPCARCPMKQSWGECLRRRWRSSGLSARFVSCIAFDFEFCRRQPTEEYIQC